MSDEKKTEKRTVIDILPLDQELPRGHDRKAVTGYIGVHIVRNSEEGEPYIVAAHDEDSLRRVLAEHGITLAVIPRPIQMTNPETCAVIRKDDLAALAYPPAGKPSAQQTKETE